MEHSPTPWFMTEFNDGHAFINDADGNFVANVSTKSEAGKVNASLIEAAPEMFAALKACGNWAADIVGAPDLRPIRAQIRAAIAKAEGK